MGEHLVFLNGGRITACRKKKGLEGTEAGLRKLHRCGLLS